MSPTQSHEAKELSLVGNVEMRIALADSDSKLESLLKVYLAPFLLKLASEHLSVRNKVSQRRYRSRLSIRMKQTDRVHARSYPSASMSIHG